MNAPELVKKLTEAKLWLHMMTQAELQALIDEVILCLRQLGHEEKAKLIFRDAEELANYIIEKAVGPGI